MRRYRSAPHDSDDDDDNNTSHPPPFGHHLQPPAIRITMPEPDPIASGSSSSVSSDQPTLAATPPNTDDDEHPPPYDEHNMSPQRRPQIGLAHAAELAVAAIGLDTRGSGSGYRSADNSGRSNASSRHSRTSSTAAAAAATAAAAAAVHVEAHQVRSRLDRYEQEMVAHTRLMVQMRRRLEEQEQQLAHLVAERFARNELETEAVTDAAASRAAASRAAAPPREPNPAVAIVENADPLSQRDWIVVTVDASAGILALGRRLDELELRAQQQTPPPPLWPRHMEVIGAINLYALLAFGWLGLWRLGRGG